MVVAVTALPFVRRTTLGADRAAWFAAMRGPRTGPDILFSSLQTRMLACAQANGHWELEKRATKKSGRATRVSVYKSAGPGAQKGRPGQRRCSRRWSESAASAAWACVIGEHGIVRGNGEQETQNPVSADEHQ